MPENSPSRFFSLHTPLHTLFTGLEAGVGALTKREECASASRIQHERLVGWLASWFVVGWQVRLVSQFGLQAALQAAVGAVTYSRTYEYEVGWLVAGEVGELIESGGRRHHCEMLKYL